ncbi:hypothetical protein [Streptomyces sp. DSM 40750]|uniref:hypothetical protein n=1 Tax=Streptomyces sp. DSM 40750 TaxID=2801030 RepID=UPI00214B6327|nr:hypothetical protein [Streptomyces sp. DSM 40750]UUU19945.1 hypothetical protein JIX55_06305 [Streptomyces sp. DSM 40750]
MASERSDGPEEAFVEALVQLHTDAPAGELGEWCAAHGIEVVPMAAGALLTGPAGRFAEAFGEHPGNRTEPRSLPVPPALRDTARSVTVLPLPDLGAGTSSPD